MPKSCVCFFLAFTEFHESHASWPWLHRIRNSVIYVCVSFRFFVAIYRCRVQTNRLVISRTFHPPHFAHCHRHTKLHKSSFIDGQRRMPSMRRKLHTILNLRLDVINVYGIWYGIFPCRVSICEPTHMPTPNNSLINWQPQNVKSSPSLCLANFKRSKCRWNFVRIDFGFS